MNASLNISKTLPDKVTSARTDYGDWQTSYEFARDICLYLKSKGINPDVIVEPTCGIGNFIAAAIDVFSTVRRVYGIEIFSNYLRQADQKLWTYKKNKRIDDYKLYNTSIFTFNFEEIIKDNTQKNILILGNPPWVTNSSQGKTTGINLPTKENIDNIRGIEAITGKGNFDIAESICNLIIDAFSGHQKTYLALLVKNSVIKNILYRQHSRPRTINNIRQGNFDAKKEFNVSVAASLFECQIGGNYECQCTLYNFYTQQISKTFGWVNNAFVSDVQAYSKTSMLDGRSPLIWRSGIKHDCSKVMELSLKDSIYMNGLKETVDVDEETIFPLLKSSDIGKGMKGVRKYMILPQMNVSEDTAVLKQKDPKTYSYLLAHAEYLDRRKSIIYKNKPRFSVFGLGKYSFAPYKIVISALYSDIIFSLVKPIAGKPVMVDDTCYLLGFEKYEYAKLTLFILQSNMLKHFIRSICFMDAKRVISRDLLMRINLYQLSKSIDFTGTNIPNEKIREYQNWLSLQTAPDLFENNFIKQS